MKFDRIIWGVLLLFIGGVLLLSNFNVIEFYWRNVWDFWPIFLIILGVNILFNRNNSQAGTIASLGILVIALGFLFFKGQEKPTHNNWWRNNVENNIDVDDDNDSEETVTINKKSFSESFSTSDANKKTILNIFGGGTSFDLKGKTDSLFLATVDGKNGKFSLTKDVTDSANTLTFRMADKKKNWSFGNGKDVALYMNTSPIWEMNLKMGAGEMKFDLADYKVRTLNFDGGAAELNIKVGDLLPITDINVKTGVADITIKVPKNSGCRIKTRTGLSTRDFTGFTKISEGVYETPNYQTSTNKIFISFEGGISNFEVDQY